MLDALRPQFSSSVLTSLTPRRDPCPVAWETITLRVGVSTALGDLAPVTVCVSLLRIDYATASSDSVMDDFELFAHVVQAANRLGKLSELLRCRSECGLFDRCLASRDRRFTRLLLSLADDSCFQHKHPVVYIADTSICSMQRDLVRKWYNERRAADAGVQ
jgi:hypothetical protein